MQKHEQHEMREIINYAKNNLNFEGSQEEKNLFNKRKGCMVSSLLSIKPNWVVNEEDWMKYAEHLMFRLCEAKAQLSAVIEIVDSLETVLHREAKVAEAIYHEWTDSQREHQERLKSKE